MKPYIYAKIIVQLLHLTKAEEFVDKNDEIDVSDASSFEHAIKKFKVVILDKIKEGLESSDDEDDGD